LSKPLVLEKKQFPRDKYCGDAVCKTAIEILMDMGLYDKLIKENKAKVVRFFSSESRCNSNVPTHVNFPD
jgi:hypothetical protein